MKKVNTKLDILKKQHRCGKAKNRDILASQLTSEKSRDNGLKNRIVPAKAGRLMVAGKIKGKAIPVTGCGVPQGCEMSRLPHFLDNRLTDGGKVVSLTRRPPFTSRKIPRTYFC
jgi:hypothetical protein